VPSFKDYPVSFTRVPALRLNDDLCIIMREEEYHERNGFEVLNLHLKAHQGITFLKAEHIVRQMHLSLNNLLAVNFSDAENNFLAVFDMSKLLSGDKLCIPVQLEHCPGMMQLHPLGHELMYLNREGNKNDLIVVRSMERNDSGYPEGKFDHLNPIRIEAYYFSWPHSMSLAMLRKPRAALESE